VAEIDVADRPTPKAKGAIRATAVSLAVAALQNEEVQRRLKAAGTEALGRLRSWNQEHGLPRPEVALGEVTRRTTRQGRLEARLERLHEAEAQLRALGPAGPRLDWLAQTLAEADTVLGVARSLPRDKRRQAQDTVDASLGEIEEALFAAIRGPEPPARA
jgi:hypothetical protein